MCKTRYRSFARMYLLTDRTERNTGGVEVRTLSTNLEIASQYTFLDVKEKCRKCYDTLAENATNVKFDDLKIAPWL